MVYDHVLMIGTTGMLSGAADSLALKTNQLTCLARTKASLMRLQGGLDRHGPTFDGVVCDYADADHFMAEIERSWKRRPFDLVVAWMHESGNESFNQLQTFLIGQNRIIQFYHVVGSAAADPSRENESLRHKEWGSVAYHQVILGFQIEKGRSRWLHHGEISTGLLEAVKRKQDRFIVGTVEPWDARP